MALKGLKVIELAGLAPAPMCGMILADFGASVIRVDKLNGVSDLDVLKNGKRSLAVNLKSRKGAEVVKKIITKSDVLIEPFRQGVMESLGLGPKEAIQWNPKLIYARLTGFGQNGPYSRMAGHDINYVALSGILSFLGRSNEKPTFPLNLLADFGGGGLTCALGILLALVERFTSGKGQIVDSAMVEGTAYLGSWVLRSQSNHIWGEPRGKNILDTGSHFYDTYETKDGKFVSIGALEPQFYEELIKKLNLKVVPEHFGNFEAGKKIFTETFKTKTRDEWCAIFEGSDACFAPVLTPEEASNHHHNIARNVFTCVDGLVVPNPAPKLSRTPGVCTGKQPPVSNGAHTREILQEHGYSNSEIELLCNENIIKCADVSSKL